MLSLTLLLRRVRIYFVKDTLRSAIKANNKLIDKSMSAYQSINLEKKNV